MIYVICYDITVPKRLAKVAKLLEGHGQRVQYSVFECDLSEREYQRLQQRLERLINTNEGDSIRTYRLCQHCSGQIGIIGKGPAPASTPDVFVV